MNNEENDTFSSLGTLAAQMLGVQAILMQELVRSQAVDAQRLRSSLAEFWAQELAQPDLSASDRRMVESVKRVISAALTPEGKNEQGG